LNISGITADKKFKIGLKQTDKLTDFITLKAYVFPYINLVWAGLIIMACGFIVSLFRRVKAANYIAALSIALVMIGLIYMFLIANN
jgi:cytochrome c biogenesis factor